MLIGIVGFINSGKGTVGDLLVDHGFHKDSFARSVKDAVSSIFGWPRELLEGDTEISRKWRETPDPFWTENFGYSFTPRAALQLLGTEAGRNVFHPDIWVVSLLNRAKGRNVVVTDVRFRNEISYIRKHGGIIIRVVRGENPVWFDILSQLQIEKDRELYMEARNVHQSEWDWVGCKFDFVLENNGTLEELSDKLNGVLTQIRI